MGKFFADIYIFLHKRRPLPYLLMAGSFLLLLYFALQVRFDEDVTGFFSGKTDAREVERIFGNLRAKDKIIVLFSAREQTEPEEMIGAAEAFEERLRQGIGRTHVREIVSAVDRDAALGAARDLYDRLPVYLADADYRRMDTLFSPENLRAKIADGYRLITSPAGIAVKESFLRDPAGLAGELMRSLSAFGAGNKYLLYDDYLFSEDLGTLMITLDPVYGSGSTGKNESLIREIETLCDVLAQEHPSIDISYFGGPAVSVYNARQIKRDTGLTLTAALLIIASVIFFSFKNKRAILLILLPVLYGGVFALASVRFLQGTMSAIAIGTGSAVLGIALSYSIHVLSHQNHVRSIRQIIEELSYPLTVGSFTTIGAFLGLLFTDSKLLQDFGLFAALSLIGTTFFCLVFLPHLLREEPAQEEPGLLRLIEKFNAYPFDKNRYLTAGIGLLFLICLFAYNRVEFDSDMVRLSLEPERFKRAEEQIRKEFGEDGRDQILLISSHPDPDSAALLGSRTALKLRELQESGEIEGYASVSPYLIPRDEQQRRIDAWNRFWTPERKSRVLRTLDETGREYGFKPGTFSKFAELLSRPYRPEPLSSERIAQSPLLKEWFYRADSAYLIVSKMQIAPEKKESVYAALASDTGTVIADRGYFAGRMADAVNRDFYLILYISSFLIFFALLISYGRIELALFTFVPMAVSWVVILGIMALLDIEFNIVNIILSTFIFGIGDDFSIFIMDGLLSEYKTGEKRLDSHKTAIFFSAFTTVAGIGSLIFAGHPALRSISVISILGMGAVVLVAYIAQPILFRLLIGNPVRRGGYPYTLSGILNTFYAFALFLSGCLILQGLILVSVCLPLDRKRKKAFFHRAMHRLCRLFLASMITVGIRYSNPCGERFEKPALIIANHQSFIDILMLLAICPKCVMVTNNWVWKSPFFGQIIRYAGFYHTGNGYRELAQKLRPRVEEGYSVIVFPEGTRSADLSVKRFRKGAFFLARTLNLDLLPVVMFGNGQICSKTQPFYIKKGIIVSRILGRIPASAETPAVNPAGRINRTATPQGLSPEEAADRETARRMRRLIAEEYGRLRREFGTPDNPWYYDALIKNYIYKGPVLEWYMRIKIRLEKNYRLFHELVPRQGIITDIGCGYGPLACMLYLLEPQREIYGIDYDPEKIETARHGFIRGERLHFRCDNAVRCDLPASDVFILNDMLHYLDPDSQQELIVRCSRNLLPEGFLLIRDGDRQKEKQHRMTRLSELFSTRICRFNKTEGALHFLSAERLGEIAEACGLTLSVAEASHRTSNTVFILRRKKYDADSNEENLRS